MKRKKIEGGTVVAAMICPDPFQTLSVPCEKVTAIRGFGFKGDRHAGTRISDVREWEQCGIPKGHEVANVREFSAISVEELTEIQEALALPDRIPFGCLGENLVISGIPELSKLPCGSLLTFSDGLNAPRTSVLATWGANNPCRIPGQNIQERFPDIPKIAGRFAKAAMGRRGIVGFVFCSGFIKRGDRVTVLLP
jgi:hypothetical protein